MNDATHEYDMERSGRRFAAVACPSVFSYQVLEAASHERQVTA